MQTRIGPAHFLSLVLITSPLLSCGSGTNINKIWGKDEASDSLLTEAKSAYDQGNFSEAEKIASQIVAKSPDNEEAAILLGYVYLSQGGLDPYRVATCLIEMSDTTGTTSKVSRCGSSTTTAKLSMVEEKVSELMDMQFMQANSSESSSDVTDTLKKLQGGLLSLTADDFRDLQEKQFQGNSDIFAVNPILVPKKVNDELRNKVFVLSKMDLVVRTVCRFVNEDPEIKADSERYKAMGCSLTSEPRNSAAKAHYLWAIAHLAESLIYQSVILYDTSATSSSNIQAASETLNTFSGDITKYALAVTDLKTALDAVFDTSDPKSMISACLNDLSSVNGAFAAISGLPAGVRQQLSKIMDKIKDLAKSIGGSATQANQTKALKTQMTEKITQKVGAQTNEAMAKVISQKTQKTVDPNTITPQDVEKLDTKEKEQVQGLCTTYDTLSKDMPADKKAASKPKGCA